MKIIKFTLVSLTIFLIFTFVSLLKTRQEGCKSLNPKEFTYFGILILFMIVINIKLFYPYFKKNHKSQI